MSKNKVEMRDSMISNLMPATYKEYNDFRLIQPTLGIPNSFNDKPLLDVIFLFDDNETHFIRSMQSMADVFSSTGGFMGVLYGIIAIFCGPI